jgi:O-acetylhomoserine/O-acetylserine sulfhydrylase-like pyridoxal-dependent enzyme
VKATITHVVNGTVITFEVIGEYIQTQQFDNGSSLIIVRDRLGGARKRVVHVNHSETIDVVYDAS